MTEPRTAGTIFDLGYERYEGRRLGRANAIRTLVAFSLRSAFGIGRGGRAKVTPFALTALTFLPVAIQVGISTTLSSVGSGANFRTISYPGQLSQTLFLLMFFAAAQAPELVVTDRQQRVLSLYLSRPLRSTDYALAKAGAFFLAMLLLTLGPQLLLVAGVTLSSATPWTALLEERRYLWPIIAAASLAAAYLAVVGVTIASLASRRGYATAGVMAFYLLLAAAAGIWRQMVDGDARRYTALANPFSVLTELARWLIAEPAVTNPIFMGRSRRRPQLEPIDGELFLYVVLTTIAIGMLVFVLRYRKTEV